FLKVVRATSLLRRTGFRRGMVVEEIVGRPFWRLVAWGSFSRLLQADFIQFGNQDALFDIELAAAIAYKERSLDLVGNKSDALHHVAYYAGTFYRVVTCIFQQDLSFKRDKILRIFSNIAAKRFRTEFFDIGIRIVAI